MDKNELLNRLARIEASTQEEWDEDVQLAKAYPYSTPIRLMALAAEQVWGDTKIDQRRQQRESLYANLSAIRSLLAKAKKHIEVSDEFDILKEINNYQEVSFKTAPKSVILSKFLEESCVNETEVEPYENVSIDSLGKKSIAEDSTLASETLAIIYEKQGKIEKAIQMYERLSSQYPEKNSIFASRIAELRKNAVQ